VIMTEKINIKKNAGRADWQRARLIVILSVLSHYNFYVVFCLSLYVRNDVTLYSGSVNGHGLNALLSAVLLNGDVVGAFAELSGDLEITEVGRNTRINRKSFVCRIYTEDILRDIYECPSSSTGEPAVLTLAVELGIASGYHLAVYVRLGLVDLRKLLCI